MKPPDFRLADGLQEGLQFLFGAFGHQLHPAIRQIADRPGDFKPVVRIFTA